MDEQSRKIVAKYVEDIHSLIGHGVQAIGRQAGESQMQGHPESYSLVQDFKASLERQLAASDARMKALGTSPTTAIQDAAAGVAGVVAGIYNQVRTEAVSKSLRDDYTFLSHCSVAYLMLMTTARSLGDHDTEELAEDGYRDCARMVMAIDRAMPRLVFQELKQDGLPAQDVSDWAQKLIHGAWDRAQGGSGSASSSRPARAATIS